MRWPSRLQGERHSGTSTAKHTDLPPIIVLHLAQYCSKPASCCGSEHWNTEFGQMGEWQDRSTRYRLWLRNRVSGFRLSESLRACSLNSKLIISLNVIRFFRKLLL